MRTLNIRLAAVLFVIVVGGAVGVYFLHRYQITRNAYVFREISEQAEQEAKEAAEQKNFDAEQKANEQAIKNLGWYVALKPDDLDALEKLCMLLADRSDLFVANKMPDTRVFGQAFGRLESLLRTDPARSKARRRLVDLAMSPAFQRYQDAKDHLQDFLLPESPKDPELLELLARCNV